MRTSVSTGFRAPTPGQQNGFNISTIFDPALGDLVNNGTIPSNSPVAGLRGGVPLRPEASVNTTAGVVFGTGPFNFTADYFRIHVSDRIGITSNFTLEDAEIDALLAQGVDAARDLRRFRFFTNAFATRSQGIDLVSTFTPIALRGNTVISAVFNYTDTAVTDNGEGLLDDRRLAEFAYALPRTRWNLGLTQRMGRASFLGRVSYYGAWYDYDSGFAMIYDPTGGIDNGFFAGRPVVDLELTIDAGGGATVAIGAQNAFDTYPDERARALSRRREVQRVHALGLQRRLLLRAARVRLGRVRTLMETALPCAMPTRRQRAALGCGRQLHVDRCPPRKPASSNGADSWRVGWAAGRGAGDRARSLCRPGIPANLTPSG